ncbi:MAG: hypothetical protein K940chlam9_00736 [Chlamydiae bacterium]|nr:hypothetical protein [Chlamydiota bacterium]
MLPLLGDKKDFRMSIAGTLQIVNPARSHVPSGASGTWGKTGRLRRPQYRIRLAWAIAQGVDTYLNYSLISLGWDFLQASSIPFLMNTEASARINAPEIPIIE